MVEAKAEMMDVVGVV